MLVRVKRGLDPVAQTQATEDAGDVVLDRAFGDNQFVSDLPIGGAGADEA